MRVLSNVFHPELQLQRETTEGCRQLLNAGRERRQNVRTLEDWQLLRGQYLAVIRSAFPPVLFDRGNPLNAKVVSTYELEDCRIENVIFESLPGWEVNGTVYLPKKPGRYPGVVCPTGHSSKTFRNYQRSARTIARNGYIAISFDPPGCSGEKQYMNDHFANGVIGYLTGIWSMTYFVADALRAIDYLETRADVDTSVGFTMTGVSGGGLTSIFSAILDECIKFCAPVCCLSEHEKIHLNDLYTSCPEQFGTGFIAAGMNYADYLCLIAPRPCLAVAGKQDEVFDIRSTERLFDEAARIYELTGDRSRLGLFIDEEAGHAYTVKMANEVAGWMNRIIKGSGEPALNLKEDDIKEIEHEKLKCHPADSVNMFTVNRDEAERLKVGRILPEDTQEKKEELCRRTRLCLGITEKTLYGFTGVEEQEPELRWFHNFQKLDIQRDKNIHIPGLLMKRANREGEIPVFLFIDENGKWEGFKQNGFLTRAGRFLEEETCENEPMILSIDVSGFGELAPEPAAYDLAAWNDIDRILTYLSVANGKPVMGLRVRDALAALNYIENRQDVDKDRIMIGGRGIGAIVALLAALLWGKASGVHCMDMLSHYGVLTEAFPYAWSQSIIIPGILQHFDLPDVAQCFAESGCKISLSNLLDEKGLAVAEDKAKELYKEAISSGVA